MFNRVKHKDKEKNMVIKTQLQTLLNKKMDRQDFLKHAAVGVIAIASAGTVSRLLSVQSQKPASTDFSYGNSAYGGNQPTKKLV